MDEDLIKEILEYVESVEVQIDGEWGAGRQFDQLFVAHFNKDRRELSDGDGDMIPSFYFRLKELLEK